MPASWANAFSPTTALLGCTCTPGMCESSRDVLKISSVRTFVSIPKKSFRVRSAITISSREALPARSPLPLIVHSTSRGAPLAGRRGHPLAPFAGNPVADGVGDVDGPGPGLDRRRQDVAHVVEVG